MLYMGNILGHHAPLSRVDLGEGPKGPRPPIFLIFSKPFCNCNNTNPSKCVLSGILQSGFLFIFRNTFCVNECNTSQYIQTKRDLDNPHLDYSY